MAPLALLALLPLPAGAGEVIYIPPPESALDQRYQYSEQLLQTVLNRTEGQYGKTELRHALAMPRDRVLIELKRGELIQVADAPSRPDFEQNLLPIRIPLRKGILGYRLLLIHEKDQARFAHIKTLDELKKLRAVLGKQWAITPVLQQHGFKLVQEIKYDNLFRLLGSDEADYFPRGVNEIFDEFAARKAAIPGLAIEKSLALYLPLPTYFFVAPNRPALAERIRHGLEAMIKDGSFEQLFQQYHRDLLQQANLAGRKIFYLDNPNLPPQTPFGRPELWLAPFNPSGQP
jgi:hypothetical protein